MNLRHLMRMKRFAQSPPSAARVKLFAAIILLCLILGLIEYLGFWPDWARVEKSRF